MSRDFLELGTTPTDEECVQVISGEDYLPAMRKECQRYKALLEKMFPIPEKFFCVNFTIKSFPHDFGSYLEVVINYDDDDPEAVEFALKVEGNLPTTWEEERVEGIKEPLYIPKLMQLWKLPSDYAGDRFYDWYPVYGQHRDSDILEQSNFQQIWEALKEIGEPEDWSLDESPVQNIRAHHWAVGWVEEILIHKTFTAALVMADTLLERIEQYPILNDEDFSERETEIVEQRWEDMNLSERVKLLEECGCNIFAARSESYPYDLDDSGRLYENLRTD